MAIVAVSGLFHEKEPPSLDGYRLLIAAIIQRAIFDADLIDVPLSVRQQGPSHSIVEHAREFLADTERLSFYIELMGMDVGGTLRHIHEHRASLSPFLGGLDADRTAHAPRATRS